MSKVYKVGIIGGGVSGAVTALELADLGIESILFEKEQSVVNGPPFCHLHAGGNLYPDISDEQCRKLMKQSIEMAKLFPQSIDQRPTFISIPKTEKYKVETIEKRLVMLVDHYKKLIAKDASNEILGDPENYYKIYTQKDLDVLSKKEAVKNPKYPDEWMTNAIQLIDYNKLKMPVILVQEYGWNLFRLGAQAQLALEKTDQCKLKLKTKITYFKNVKDQSLGYNWEIHANNTIYKVDYLVNSCGFETGELDQSLHLNAERLIEFKAAYVAKWMPIAGMIPELIFHGERDTPHGMAQLTPYCDNYYQIHGMTRDITLFKNGLVKSKVNKAHPKFNQAIQDKLYKGWEVEEINIRTKNAVDFIAQFVPTFSTATLGGPPLFGAQQIPGDDPTLRIGEVNFPMESYARSEIIKASSALTVAKQIIKKIQEEKIITPIKKKKSKNSILDDVSKEDIDSLAKELTTQRGYPAALSHLVIERV